jgi:glycolate oxidase iron-sulfur subunit
MKTEFPAALLADPANAASEAEIRRCVRCGFCTATCPTYVLLGDELDSPRGRIYLIKEMLETEAQPSPEVVSHIDRCLSCLACVTTCPSGVNYRRLIDHARAYVRAHFRRPALERFYRGVLALVLPYPARFRAALVLARLAKPLAPLLHKVAALKPAAAMLDLAPARAPRAAPRAAPAPAGPRKGRVAVLRGCAEPALRPQVRAATLRLFARMGLEVIEAPGEACCGALVHHMGREAAARAAARVNVDAWTRLIEAGGLDAIVVTAAGCGTSVKTYGELLAHDPAYAAKAARVSALARDVSEVVAEQGLPPATAPRPLTVAYQSACSLQHGQGVREAPPALLAQAGFTVKEPAESHLCCGSAGTYNILQPQIAAQLKARKLDRLGRLAPDVVATGNIGCLTQLSGGGVPVVHTVELLDWATGGPAPAELAGL